MNLKLIVIALVVDTYLVQKQIYVSITSKSSKALTGYCSICNRKKSMTVRDNTIKAESLGDFFKNLGKKGLNVSKKTAKNATKNPGRALDIAAASRNPKNVMSTPPDLIISYNTGKGLNLGKIFIILYQLNGDRLYPLAQFENKNIDLEQRVEKKLNDVNSFNNHMNNIEELITYFKDKNNKSKKKYKKNKQ